MQAIFYVSTMSIGLLPRSLTLPKTSLRLGGELCIPRACSAAHRMLARMIPYKEAHITPFPSLSLDMWPGRYLRIVKIRHGRRTSTAAGRPPIPPQHDHALSIFLPLVFLLCSILRPVLVRMRLRNPCLRMRISRDGRFMFMCRRGPQRICEPAPASAGCDVIAVLGTTSAIPVPPTASAAAADAGAGVKALGMRGPAAGLLAKMLGGAAIPGRRLGREEKDLCRLQRSRQSVIFCAG